MASEGPVLYWVTRREAEGEVIWPVGSSKPFHVLFMCLSGAVGLRPGKEKQEIGPGESLLFRADRVVGQVRALRRPTEYQWASFYSPQADRLPSRPTATGPEVIRTLFARLLNAFRRSGAHGEATTFWLSALLRALEEDHNPRTPSAGGGAEAAVRSVIQQIDAHPEMFWSVADLAARSGYSQTHFTRTFKKLTGQSSQQYLIEARIQRARRLLQDTELNVSQIAAELGYRDVYHFSKQFRRRCGEPPTAFRTSRR